MSMILSTNTRNKVLCLAVKGFGSVLSVLTVFPCCFEVEPGYTYRYRVKSKDAIRINFFVVPFSIKSFILNIRLCLLGPFQKSFCALCNCCSRGSTIFFIYIFPTMINTPTPLQFANSPTSFLCIETIIFFSCFRCNFSFLFYSTASLKSLFHFSQGYVK